MGRKVLLAGVSVLFLMNSKYNFYDDNIASIGDLVNLPCH